MLDKERGRYSMSPLDNIITSLAHRDILYWRNYWKNQRSKDNRINEYADSLTTTLVPYKSDN